MGALVIAVAPVFAVALAGGFMMGAAHLTSASTLNTAIQLQVDESARAKVLAVYLSMLTASNPIGQLILGQLIDRTDPRFAYGVAGGAFLVIAGFLAVGGRLEGLDTDAGEITEAYGGRSSQPHPLHPAGTDHQPGAERGVLVVGEMTLAVVTVVTDGTPAAGRPGGGGGITLAGRKHQHPFDAVDDSSDGREEKVFGDVLDLEAALVEVIRGQSAAVPMRIVPSRA